MTSNERYSRHVLLPEVGPSGQERLRQARVLIVGLGGLGSPAAMYLASAGVGEIALNDFDHVELSNLQRQIAHGTHDLGRDKVASAADTLRELNPEVGVRTLGWALDDHELRVEVSRAHVVVDACDNFESRFAINRACLETTTPWVSGAAVRMEGQVTVFDPRDAQSPCYRCLYNDDSSEGEACSQVGVLAPLLGVIGSVQAVETLKLLLNLDTRLTGRVAMVDALHMDWRELRLRRDPQCPACSNAAAREDSGNESTPSATVDSPTQDNR